MNGPLPYIQSKDHTGFSCILFGGAILGTVVWGIAPTREQPLNMPPQNAEQGCLDLMWPISVQYFWARHHDADARHQIILRPAYHVSHVRDEKKRPGIINSSRADVTGRFDLTSELRYTEAANDVSQNISDTNLFTAESDNSDGRVSA